MESRVKAEELIEKFMVLFSVQLENTIVRYEAIECAKVVCDEMLSTGFNISYWQSVKHELF